MLNAVRWFLTTPNTAPKGFNGDGNSAYFIAETLLETLGEPARFSTSERQN
jgi:hypothetical protein